MNKKAKAPDLMNRGFGVGAERAVQSSHINDNREQGKGQARPKFDWPKLWKAVEFFKKERLRYSPSGRRGILKFLSIRLGKPKYLFTGGWAIPSFFIRGRERDKCNGKSVT